MKEMTTTTHQIMVHTKQRKAKISRHIFGHFSEHLGRCIYGGYYVGDDSLIPNVRGIRKDVVEALRQIRIPNLRWPGGCFADEYHWKDGIGPKEGRKRMVNTHWGGVVEDNAFGTHEFMDLCAQLGCEPYINGNVGSGTVQEMQEWVEYLTFGGESPMSLLRAKNGRADPWKVHFWGVGNENWGCGGCMRPEYYADEYRRYQTYVRSFGEEKIYKIACGPNTDHYEWTDTVMKNAGRYMNALTLHYYTVPGNSWQHKGSATVFDESEYYTTLHKATRMEELISNHLQIMHRHDPEHKVGLIVDEWGTWYDVEPGTHPGFLYQQNTMRDALVAALTLDIFCKHADRLVMANLAQTINVLQAVLLTDGENVVRTPTYHVFDLYKAHQDAMLVDSYLHTDEVGGEDNPVARLSATSSIAGDGTLTVTLSNSALDASAEVMLMLDADYAGTVHSRILMGKMNGCNDFDAPDRITPVPLPVNRETGRMLKVTLAPCSVAEITVMA